MSIAGQFANSQSVYSQRTKHHALPVMNVVLWTMQMLWGVFFSFTGFGKIMSLSPDVWNQTLHQPVAWFHVVPQGLFVFIGVCEFLGGVGLILPATTRVKPKLTPLAALGLTLVMVIAAIFHIVRGEFSFFVPMNLVLGGFAAFIAYGRWMVGPIVAEPINTPRMVTGLMIFTALVLVGFFPVWYQLTHIH